MSSDPIAELAAGWSAEIPDLDSSAMLTVARLNRAATLLRRHIDRELHAVGSSLAELDVLSALRRQGPPYRLKPSELARATLLSPSGMTHRIDLLEEAGLVARVPDPNNRRIAPVELTETGVDASEQLVRHLTATEEEALGGLEEAKRTRLDALLNELLTQLVAIV